MFVEHGIFKFVLHVGPFNAFLLKRVSAGTPPQAGAPVPPGVPPAPSAAGAAAASAAGGAAASAPTPVPTPPKTDSKVLPPAWLDGMTFADMIQDQELVMQISKLVVFVSGAATLAEAKAALDRVSGAQDIIVTATGDGTEPMLGWLTNVDLTKALQVS
jgi:hypothetical protein